MNTHQPILSDDQKAFVISLCKDRIMEADRKIESMEPNYTEKRAFFEDVKREFEALDTELQGYRKQIDEAQDVINVTMGLKMNPEVEIEIAAKKKKVYQQHVRWFPIISNTLKTADRFLTFEQLWDLLEHDPTVIAGYGGNTTKARHQKMAVLSTINKHIGNINPEHHKEVITYRKHFGLPQWVDNQGKLVFVQHASQFVTEAPVKSIEQKPVRNNGRKGQRGH